MADGSAPPSRPTPALSFRGIVRVAVLLLASGLLAACASVSEPGSLRSESLGDDPVYLAADFPTVVYAHDPGRGTSIMLSDIPVEALLDGSARSGQVLHIELLWLPRAGATPMDSSATNASVHHVIISDGEIGVYGGAGFAMPHGSPGEDELKISLRDATVRLLESTPGFVDPLSPARLTGTFTARNDPLLARKLHRAVSQMVTNVLDRSVYVRGASTDEERAALSPPRCPSPVPAGTAAGGPA